MKIRKITTIIAIAGLIGLIGSIGECKATTNVKLLATKSTSYGCVINGDNQLIIKNKNGDVEGYVSVGQMLNLGASSNGEIFVTVQETGVKGYLNNTDVLNISSDLNSKFETLNLDGKTINISSKVNLRTEPSMSGKIIDKLNNDISIKIIGKQGQWYKVKADNKVGYIFDEYIGVLNSSEISVCNKTVGVISQKKNITTSDRNNIESSSIISKNMINKASNKVTEVAHQVNNKVADVKQFIPENDNMKKEINHNNTILGKVNTVNNIKSSSIIQKADDSTVTTKNNQKKESAKIQVSTNTGEHNINKTVVKNEGIPKNSVKEDSNKKQIVEPKKENGTKSNEINSKDKKADISKVGKNQNTSDSKESKTENTNKASKVKDTDTNKVNKEKNTDNNKINKEQNTNSSKGSKNTNKTSEMTTLPNVPLQSWETGFNTVQNKMNGQNSNNGLFMMDIYTPENPAGYVGGTVYVRFANTNEICSGKLLSLITPKGGTNSNYGYFYKIPLYYKNTYKGTLYYGTNTYGDIQNGGYVAPGQNKPIPLTLDSGYWSLPDMGNNTVFWDGCYFINGVLQKGFQNIGGNIYYFGEDGQDYMGTYIINGKKYVFSYEGELISGTPPKPIISKLPTNIKLQKSYNLNGSKNLWSMMHANLKDGKVINIYIPKNPEFLELGSDEEVYSYTKISGEKGSILGQAIYYTDNLSDLGTIVTSVSENGKIIGEISFGKSVEDGVKGTYKNLQTNVTEDVIFRPGYENL
ncbi:MAG: SH3 domain-containing protein [Sarcina sp.]